MKINFYTGDLPASFKASNIIALDSETMGLNPKRDKLCLVQISNGDDVCHLVKIDLSTEKPLNLIKILKNNKIQKIFHYARFDVDSNTTSKLILKIFTVLKLHQN